MSNKLTINHIAKRLPYGLKCIDEEYNQIFKVCSYRQDSDEWLIYDNIDGSVEEYSRDVLKPILFPLSALKKEITVNGETFVPKDSLEATCETIFYSFERLFYIHGVQEAPYHMVNKLLEWHIDIDDLIGQGLAISVFDLPENPYK